ncbi:hypothetical protein [Nonomuraea sp. GTA35]|uniref:hypothetical protein n=1 Tax=Nonomuraea sp. GTA35 TaxID=1676746 RepID=UPI0035C08140
MSPPGDGIELGDRCSRSQHVVGSRERGGFLAHAGSVPAASAIAAEIRQRADLAVQDEDGETEGFSLLLDVLLGMPPAALAASREVGPALEAVRRRFGDGITTYEENGEIREYTVYEIRLADLIEEKIAEQIQK